MKRASAALGNCLSSYAASFLSRRVKARRGGACRAFFFICIFICMTVILWATCETAG